MAKIKPWHATTTPGFALKRDVAATLWGQPVTLPSGASVLRVEGNGGGYAIADTALLIRLSGNSHDPVYRFAWVDESDVVKAEG